MKIHRNRLFFGLGLFGAAVGFAPVAFGMGILDSNLDGVILAAGAYIISRSFEESEP